jgi:hypothetical protein
MGWRVFAPCAVSSNVQFGWKSENKNLRSKSMSHLSGSSLVALRFSLPVISQKRQ